MGNYIVTGAAGFIGARTAEMLVQEGHTVVGIANLNDAYDPRMKEYRLQRLKAMPGFTFQKLDISEKSIVEQFAGQKFDGVINLAARAGVRFSVEDPWVFVQSNVVGTLNMLETGNRPANAAYDPPIISPVRCRASKGKGFHIEDSESVRRQALRHVLLVGPRLGVPVRGGDQQDVPGQIHITFRGAAELNHQVWPNFVPRPVQ